VDDDRETARGRSPPAPEEGVQFGHDLALGEERVTLELARAVEEEGMISIPFRWRSRGSSPLFTTLEGHLEISRFGASGTHVSLLGNYEPPTGYFDRRAVRMGLHHQAEARLRAFLRRVADHLVGPAESIAS